MSLHPVLPGNVVQVSSSSGPAGGGISPTRVIIIDTTATGTNVVSTAQGAFDAIAALTPAVDDENPAAILVGIGSFGATTTPPPVEGLSIIGYGQNVSAIGSIPLAGDTSTEMWCNAVTLGGFTKAPASGNAGPIVEVYGNCSIKGDTTLNGENGGAGGQLVLYYGVVYTDSTATILLNGDVGTAGAAGGQIQLAYGVDFEVSSVSMKGSDGGSGNPGGQGGILYIAIGSYGGSTSGWDLSPGADNGNGPGAPGSVTLQTGCYHTGTVTGNPDLHITDSVYKDKYHNDLPTSDPHVAGAWWKNLTIVTVSAG